MDDELDIIEQEPVQSESLTPIVAGEFDVQVATAKKFPRMITRAMDNARSIATMSEATSRTCGYLVPRAGKNITGPSVHLARILAQSWGNLRVSQQVVGEEDRFVICEAVCWDLETNLAIKTQVKKRITDKKGARYNDDMIAVTGNAGMAIAFRNSVFAVIPKSIVDKVYEATRRKITGDLTTEDKLIAKRKEVLLTIEKNYGVDEKKILKFFKFNQPTQIKSDEIVQLIDLMQSFKDGDTTPDQVFGDAMSTEEAKKINDLLTGKNKPAPVPVPEPKPEPTPEPMPEPPPTAKENPKEPKLI